MILEAVASRINAYSGYFRITACKGSFKVFITEFLSDGKVLKYSYTLLRDKEVILRYDNAPHHIEVLTHPHYKHVKGKLSHYISQL